MSKQVVSGWAPSDMFGAANRPVGEGLASEIRRVLHVEQLLGWICERLDSWYGRF